MNLFERAFAVWPGVSDTDMDLLLWNTTSFPCGNDDHIIDQLERAHASSNGNVTKAVCDAIDEVRRIMTQIPQDKLNEIDIR